MTMNVITRIATFIKSKLKKSDNQTKVEKYRVNANIAKLIFLRIKIHTFMMIRQLFHVNNVCKNVLNGLRTFWSQL